MTNIKIRTARLCWFTRGRLWDYTILLRPSTASHSGWLKPLETIFDGIEPAFAPFHLIGTITWDREGDPLNSRYIGCAFLDSDQSDRDSRPIKHYFIYLLDRENPDDFPMDWHLQLARGLHSSYMSIYSLSASDLSKEKEDTTIFNERELLHRFRQGCPAEFFLENDQKGPPGFVVRDVDLRESNHNLVHQAGTSSLKSRLANIITHIRKYGLLIGLIAIAFLASRACWHWRHATESSNHQYKQANVDSTATKTENLKPQERSASKISHVGQEASDRQIPMEKRPSERQPVQPQAPQDMASPSLPHRR